MLAGRKNPLDYTGITEESQKLHKDQHADFNEIYKTGGVAEAISFLMSGLALQVKGQNNYASIHGGLDFTINEDSSVHLSESIGGLGNVVVQSPTTIKGEQPKDSDIINSEKPTEIQDKLNKSTDPKTIKEKEHASKQKIIEKLSIYLLPKFVSLFNKYSSKGSH